MIENLVFFEKCKFLKKIDLAAFLDVFTAKTVGPMKKFSRVKKFENHLKNSFLGVKSC